MCSSVDGGRMTIQIGYPGYSAKRKGVILETAQIAALVAIVLGVAFMVFALVTWVLSLAWWIPVSMSLLVAAVAWAGLRRAREKRIPLGPIARRLLAATTAFGRRLHADRPSRTWWQGAEGEDRTAETLAALSDDYILFNDFHPLGAGGETEKWNVDHILIGPNGVFVIETKNYTRALVKPANVDRVNAKNIAQADRNANTFKSQLKTWSAGALADLFVTPLLVYTQDGAKVTQIREGRVKVLPVRLLVTHLQEYEHASIDGETCYRLARALFYQIDPLERSDFTKDFERYGAVARHAREARMAAAASADGTSEGSSPECAPGWYPDPRAHHETRYWDGSVWTGHVMDGGRPAIDPV